MLRNTPFSTFPSQSIPLKFTFFLLICDVLALSIAVFLTQGVSLNCDTTAIPYHSYYALFGALVISVGLMKGHYTRRVPWWSQIRQLIRTFLSLAALDIAIRIALHECLSTYSLSLTWLALIIFAIISRYIALHLVTRTPEWKLPVALMGDAQMIVDSFHAFYADSLTGYEVKVALLYGASREELDLSFVPKEHPPIDIVEVNDHFDHFLREHGQYFYIISMEEFRGEKRDRLMTALTEARRNYAIVPPIKRLHLHGMEPHYFFGNDVMLLHKRRSWHFSFGQTIKRLFDICAVSLTLPVIGLLTAIIWICKRMEGSRDPLFYGGERVGMHGRMFPCWKFATMKPGADMILKDVLDKDPAAKAEWDKYQKLRNDPRIDSSISHFLRKTSLDELPQLWNVFRGDMSLVGPRPILPTQKEDYGKDYHYYTLVRPGLTGLWQVSGRNETSFEQRLVWDKWYIQNWSLWHDIVVLIKTVRVFITGSGAF